MSSSLNVFGQNCNDLTAAESAIFPGGICDWSKPGIGQQPLAGTWQTFN